MILKSVKSIHIMCVSLVGALTPPFKLQIIVSRGLGSCEEGPTEDIEVAVVVWGGGGCGVVTETGNYYKISFLNDEYTLDSRVATSDN